MAETSRAATFQVVRAIEELDARPGHIISFDRTERMPVAVVALHGREAEHVIRRHLDRLRFQSGDHEALRAPAAAASQGHLRLLR